MEEKLTKIVYLVFLCVAILASIVSTIIAVYKNRKSGDKVATSDVLNTLYDKMLKYLPITEKAMAAFKGVCSSEVFSSMKLNDVLNKIRSDCLSEEVVFDEEYWTNEIKNIIAVTKEVNKK